jgi:hypothetical protein
MAGCRAELIDELRKKGPMTSVIDEITTAIKNGGRANKPFAHRVSRSLAVADLRGPLH